MREMIIETPLGRAVTLFTEIIGNEEHVLVSRDPGLFVEVIGNEEQVLVSRDPGTSAYNAHAFHVENEWLRNEGFIEMVAGKGVKTKDGEVIPLDPDPEL